MTQADPSKQELEAIFNEFDKDKSGKIEVAELKSAVRQYFQSVGKKPTDEDIDEAVKGILQLSDSSGDGKIDKKEWLQYFNV